MPQLKRSPGKIATRISSQGSTHHRTINELNHHLDVALLPIANLGREDGFFFEAESHGGAHSLGPLGLHEKKSFVFYGHHPSPAL
jgi:hypothetical protein